MSNNFKSRNNENVANVGANRGIINIGDKPPPNIKQTSDNHSPNILLIFICFLVFAVTVLGIFIAKQPIIIQNPNVNSNSNSQSNEVLQNTNIILRESNHDRLQLNVNKPKSNSSPNGRSTGKTTKNSQRPSNTLSPNKTSKTVSKTNLNATLPDCAFTSTGC